jgi:hypothetical protein
LSEYYWHNINTASPLSSFYQHTNLIDKSNYGGKHIYYMGTYVPNEGELMKKSDEKIKEEFFDYLKKIFPKFDIQQIDKDWVFKFKNAQHIVTLNYKIPQSNPSVRLGGHLPLTGRGKSNIYVANFAQIYPEDRGTNFAVREGEKIAKIITN